MGLGVMVDKVITSRGLWVQTSLGLVESPLTGATNTTLLAIAALARRYMAATREPRADLIKCDASLLDLPHPSDIGE